MSPEEQEAIESECHRANDELWGYLQSNPDINVRAHMSRNLSTLYERLFAALAEIQQSRRPSATDVSTASLTSL
jgi:hypothetical protein